MLLIKSKFRCAATRSSQRTMLPGTRVSYLQVPAPGYTESPIRTGSSKRGTKAEQVFQVRTIICTFSLSRLITLCRGTLTRVKAVVMQPFKWIA